MATSKPSTSSKTKSAAAADPKGTAPAAHAKGKANPGLGKPVHPDDKLAVIIGKEPLARTEMTKKLWEYIRKHKLQDEKNRQMINADAALKAVFDNKAQVSMFEMNKLVNAHLIKK